MEINEDQKEKITSQCVTCNQQDLAVYSDFNVILCKQFMAALLRHAYILDRLLPLSNKDRGFLNVQ